MDPLTHFWPALLVLCFLVNHPFRFSRTYGLSTPTLLEKSGLYLRESVGAHIPPRVIAFIALTAMIAIVVVSGIR